MHSAATPLVQRDNFIIYSHNSTGPWLRFRWQILSLFDEFLEVAWQMGDDILAVQPIAVHYSRRHSIYIHSASIWEVCDAWKWVHTRKSQQVIAFCIIPFLPWILDNRWTQGLLHRSNMGRTTPPQLQMDHAWQVEGYQVSEGEGALPASTYTLLAHVYSYVAYNTFTTITSAALQ